MHAFTISGTKKVSKVRTMVNEAWLPLTSLLTVAQARFTLNARMPNK